jgi:hypothetical protein
MKRLDFCLLAFFGVLVALILPGCSESSVNGQAVASQEVTVSKWGPQTTKAGVAFSVQPNSNSALWFEQRGVRSATSVEVWFGDTKLPGLVIKPDEMGSVEVFPELLAEPGKYPIFLKVISDGKRVDLGFFEVIP